MQQIEPLYSFKSDYKPLDKQQDKNRKLKVRECKVRKDKF